MMHRHLFFAAAVCACAGPNPYPNTGRVEASLTATPSSGSGGNTLGVQEIIVTIDKVTAHSTTAGWVTLTDTDVKVDLLKLAQHTQALGFQNVPAGKVTQLRLYVLAGGEQYVTRDDGQRIDLKVPSGIQSGIKLKGLFDVNACEATSVPLQFDGKKSIWVHPTGGQDLWILRPVIHTGKIRSTPTACPGTPGAGGSGEPSGNPGGTAGGDPAGTPTGTGGGSGNGTGGGSGNGTIDEGTPPGTGPGGAGTVCAAGSGCLSGVCTNGFCALGGADAPCNAGADCSSGTCSAGACVTPPNLVGAGGACALDAACVSGSCLNGACAPGGQGQPCASAADCSSELTCMGGSCQAQIN